MPAASPKHLATLAGVVIVPAIPEVWMVLYLLIDGVRSSGTAEQARS